MRPLSDSIEWVAVCAPALACVRVCRCPTTSAMKRSGVYIRRRCAHTHLPPSFIIAKEWSENIIAYKHIAIAIPSIPHIFRWIFQRLCTVFSFHLFCTHSNATLVSFRLELFQEIFIFHLFILFFYSVWTEKRLKINHFFHQKIQCAVSLCENKRKNAENHPNRNWIFGADQTKERNFVVNNFIKII